MNAPQQSMSVYLGRAARTSVSEAQRQAHIRGHAEVGPVHLLLGVCLAAGLDPALQQRGVSLSSVLRALETRLGPVDPVRDDGASPRSKYGAESIAVLSAATRAAHDHGTSCLSAVNLARTVLDRDPELASELQLWGFTTAVLSDLDRS